MSGNLADYFGGTKERSDNASSRSREMVDDDDDMGPSVSMAVEAEDDEHFKRSTFNLKRTRSMGLLDGNSGTSLPSLRGSGSGSDMVSGSESPEEDYNGSPSIPSESTSPPVPETDSYLVPHDDNDLMHEPKRHVDYLSHQWKESEISQSWKYIILKKKKQNEDLVNAARLENASWRTWAKARNNLRTVSPEVVNWSKDSDVTWLYGPVVRQTANEQEGGSEEEYGYGSDDETSKRLTTIKSKKSRGQQEPKPILKKRTVSEIIKENSLWKLNVARQHRKNLSSTQAMMDGYGNHLDAASDYDALAAKVNAQYFSSQPLPPSQAPPAEEQYENADQSSVLSQQQDLNSQHAPYVPSEENIFMDSTQPSARQSPAPLLESILTSPSKRSPKGDFEQKDRHIHFNDRVEQCMALAIRSDDDDDDHDYDDVEDDSEDEFGPQRSSHLEYSKGQTGFTGTNYDDNDEQSLGSDYDQELNTSSSEEDAGLFINARFSRKPDGLQTSGDQATVGAESISSKNSIPPIIKLLPATTLNYGSDEEDFGDDDDNYGSNAVSHNVNTFRGYDYMYDYNSVYTGDTSSFMAVNNCDMIDVPEGLQTPIEDHAPQPMILDQDDDETQLPSESSSREAFTLDSDSDSYGPNGDSQFIEDTQVKGSEDEADNLDDLPDLKRSSSLASSHATSLQNLRSSTPVIPQTHSFITGKPLRPIEHSGDGSHFQLNTNDPISTKPRNKFSFVSDSESESNSDEDMTHENGGIKSLNQEGDENQHWRDIAPDSSKATVNPEMPVYGDPALGTAVSPISKSQGHGLPSGSLTSMVGSSGDFRTSLSDVAISGYISPRNDSMQSMVAKEKMVDHSKSPADVENMNKHLQDWHLDPNGEKADGVQSENVQKMMASAREIANKYLHSWKK
ncbi:LADA_0B07074g1_1 [Lachancea dasiensis]|uniref:LADA_0B07074g1_1 n=1 Tax=Lachancea dasiensis TaxID=1072105 RepID=A0A1G4IU83_9SACH|nr:LADA_0B07074g1_1 [Lachancea dasiensis]